MTTTKDPLESLTVDCSPVRRAEEARWRNALEWALENVPRQRKDGLAQENEVLLELVEWAGIAFKEIRRRAEEGDTKFIIWRCGHELDRIAASHPTTGTEGE